jgi:hypothetical protein
MVHFSVGEFLEDHGDASIVAEEHLQVGNEEHIASL